MQSSRREKERPVHHAVTPVHVLRVRMVCITVFMQHVANNPDKVNGTAVTDHGIAVLNNSAVVQYHAMLVEPFMVLVIEHMPRRIGWLPLSPSAPRIRWSVTMPLQTLGMRIKCGQMESNNV